MKCDRCGNNKMTSFTMSRFNTDEVCAGCEEREKRHPLYQAAHDAEAAEVQKGNLNFPGVGCPADLYQPEV